jgi:hypothetical protein
VQKVKYNKNSKRKVLKTINKKRNLIKNYKYYLLDSIKDTEKERASKKFDEFIQVLTSL